MIENIVASTSLGYLLGAGVSALIYLLLRPAFQGKRAARDLEEGSSVAS